MNRGGRRRRFQPKKYHTSMWQETAALRDFSPPHVRFGSSPCSNARTRAWASGSFSGRCISTPIRCTRSLCCARAASGQAGAAPPSSVMNSRRLLTRSPRRRARCNVGFRSDPAVKSLPGPDLTRSEFGLTYSALILAARITFALASKEVRGHPSSQTATTIAAD